MVMIEPPCSAGRFFCSGIDLKTYQNELKYRWVIGAIYQHSLRSMGVRVRDFMRNQLAAAV
jgi:hypothetical protein